jgi:hypothetical protein
MSTATKTSVLAAETAELEHSESEAAGLSPEGSVSRAIRARLEADFALQMRGLHYHSCWCWHDRMGETA